MNARKVAVAAVLPLLLTGVACGDDGTTVATASKTPGVSCDGQLEPADAAAALPTGVPNPDNATMMTVETQGATKRYFGRTPGDDLVKARDRLKDAFAAAGYTIVGTDQEEGIEADLEFAKGDTEGSVQVISLCEGNLRIRWRIGPK